MLISCDRCATTYTLDDALIPASGAQVQCTKCGNVFTAMKPRESASGPSAAPNPPPSRPRAPAAGAGSKTMIFGGASGAGPEANKPPAQAPAGSKTMIFGGATGTAPPPSKPSSPAAPSVGSKTMMFAGGGVSVAPAVPPAKPSAPAPASAGSKTMVFGGLPPSATPEASKPPAQAPAAATNKTMMFGGLPPVGAAPEAAKPQGRAAPAAAGSKTMIFGGVPGAGPDSKAPPVLAPATAPAGNKTMIFGGQPGALPPEPKSKPRGAGPQTMMFGAPAPVEPNTGPPQQSQTGRTLQFGPPGEAGVSDDSGQMVFGADEARDHPGALTEGTVRIDQNDLERMRREHGDLSAATPGDGTPAVEKPPAPREKTQLFAMSDAAPAAEAPPPAEKPKQPDRTMLFGLNPEGRPVDAPKPAAAKPVPHLAMGRSKPPVPGLEDEDDAASAKPTQQFTGLESGPVPTDRSRTRGTDPAMMESSPSVQIDASITDTLDPDPRRAPHRLSPQGDSGRELLATTLPNVQLGGDSGPDLRRVELELPPEEGAPPQLLNGLSDEPMSNADEAALLREQSSRRNRLLMVVLGGLALVLLLAVAWGVVGKDLYARWTGNDIPIEAMQATEKVVAQLKGDDVAQRAAAMERIRGLLAAHPNMLEVHAALVTALALEFDEVQDRERRFADSLTDLEARIKRLEAKKPSDWERDRDLTAAEYKKLYPRREAQTVATKKVDSDLAAAVKAMNQASQGKDALPTQVVQAMQRATALYYASHGDTRSTEAYRAWGQAGGEVEHDDLPELALPMQILNQRPVDKGALATAIDSLKKLTAKDNDLIRAFVLLARAQLDREDVDAADEAVEKVLAWKTQHPFAEDLKRRIGEVRIELKAKSPPSPEH